MSFNTDRQEAKSLLLKGCYRMAANRYTSLLSQPPPNLPPRELSILHLNLGICHQFQDKLTDSLTSINRAIQVDPSYEKAYFRKVQVLMAMGKYEQASNVPCLNKEIAAIVEQARTKYSRELVGREWGEMGRGVEGAMQSGKWQLVEELHRRIYEKYTELTSEKFQQEMQNGLFKKYIVFLSKQPQNENTKIGIQKFFELMYKLFVTRKQNQSDVVCHSFWQKILQLFVFKRKSIEPQTIKLISFCPIYALQNVKILLEYFNQNLQSILNEKSYADCLLICFSYNINLLQKQPKVELVDLEPLVPLKDKVMQEYEKYLNQQEWKNSELINTILECINELIRLVFPFGRKSGENTGFKKLYYLKNQVYILKSKQPKENTEIDPKFIQQLLETIKTNELSLASLTLVNSIIDLFPNIKSIKQCQQQPSTIVFLSQSLKELQVSPKYFLLACILAKLAFPADQSSKLNISKIISSIPNNPHIAFRQFQLICILNLTSKQTLIKLLENSHMTLQIIEKISNYLKTQGQSVERVKLRLKLIQFLYFIYVDNEQQTEKRYAENMGVDKEQIKAARMMQGDIKKQEVEKIRKLRTKFIEGSQKLIPILEYLSAQYERSPTDSNSRLKSIIVSLSKSFPQRFYPSPFIDLFLSTHPSQSDKLCRDQTYVFFSSILKRLNNPQLLLYRHHRPILFLLLQSLQHANHQLTIFESLLSLVHLSTLPWQDNSVNIKPVCRQLYEENEYLIHGALETLNNFLLKGKGFYGQVDENDWKVVGALLGHYREVVGNGGKGGKQETDYAHPHKIYLTVVGLMMVVEEYRKVEVKELQDLDFVIEQAKKMNENQRLHMLIKVVHYYHLKGTLNKKTLMQSCKQQIETIKRTLPDKYANLAKIMGPL